MPHLSANDPRAALMLRLADRAGEIAMRYFQSADLSVDRKPDESPVTIADREIESALRAAITSAFPDDAILGEEHGEFGGASGWRWVIDPIDGTVTFATGVPLFGTLIGIEHGGTVVAGVCSMPALGERVWATEGGGAWWERRAADGAFVRTPARVRPCASLAEALVCTTGLEYFERARCTDTLLAMSRAAGRIRGWSDCYGGMLVATGRADGWLDPVMNPWDSGPFPVILAEAGGVFTDFHGSPDIRGGSAVAGSARVHAELLRIAQASASHEPSKANA
jgi:histidinol-phosphatase